MSRIKLVSLILSLGLALSFLYAAASGFLHPSDWVTFFPNILRNNIRDSILVNWWGIFEIILAVWLVSGKRIFIPSIISFLVIAGVILINISTPDAIFSDFSALTASLVLSIIHFPRRHFNE